MALESSSLQNEASKERRSPKFMTVSVAEIRRLMVQWYDNRLCEEWSDKSLYKAESTGPGLPLKSLEVSVNLKSGIS